MEDTTSLIETKTDTINETKPDNLNETKPDTINETKPISDDDINVLSGPNDVDVAIRPDVKENRILIQFCSCSVIFSCFRS